MSDTMKLDFKEVDRIITALEGNKEKVGRMIGFEIQSQAQQRAPRDTSAMANSIYTLTKNYDGFGAATSAAKQANPNVITERVPKPTGNVIARVAVAVNYGSYVEMGTSRMAAQPYLYPAGESVTSKINDGSYWKVLTE